MRPKTIHEYAELPSDRRAALRELPTFTELFALAEAQAPAFVFPIGGQEVVYAIERDGADIVGVCTLPGQQPVVVARATGGDEIAALQGIAADLAERRIEAAAPKPVPDTPLRQLRWDPRKGTNPHPEKPHPWEQGGARPPGTNGNVPQGQTVSVPRGQERSERLDALEARFDSIERSVEAMQNDLAAVLRHLTGDKEPATVEG